MGCNSSETICDYCGKIITEGHLKFVWGEYIFCSRKYIFCSNLCSHCFFNEKEDNDI